MIPGDGMEPALSASGTGMSCSASTVFAAHTLFFLSVSAHHRRSQTVPSGAQWAFPTHRRSVLIIRSVECEDLTGRTPALSGLESRLFTPCPLSRVESLHTPPAMPGLPTAFRALTVTPGEHCPSMPTRTPA